MNDYLRNFVDGFIKAFRAYNEHSFSLTIFGLGSFVEENDGFFSELIGLLGSNGFDVSIEGTESSIDSVMVFYTDTTEGRPGYFKCCIDSLPLLIELSSKTNIPLYAIIIMKTLSQLVCREKTLYKAIVLDLDDTLWKGTLAEESVDCIKQRLTSDEGVPFLYFMRFVSALAKELGIFVAICSRNNEDDVVSAIDEFDESIFPLKGQIDCIIANNNKKSDNIKSISEELSILPNAIVFIDDNKIVRDEVRNATPKVFVPEWSNHYDLVTLLISICAFERLNISKSAQGRKHRLKILREERSNSFLPDLKASVRPDDNHASATSLFAKSNQFKFNKKPTPKGSTSLVFTLYRASGEEIGDCSAINYSLSDGDLRINNWAISCAFFQIGLEEFVLMYLIRLSENRRVIFDYENGEYNLKVKDLIGRYANFMSKCDSGCEIILHKDGLVEELSKNTNIELI